MPIPLFVSQGAGVMDVTAAALGDLYVTAKDAKSSLTLGNVTDTFEFDVRPSTIFPIKISLFV